MRASTQRGFSLVELVAVIVLLGIIGVGISSFIRNAMEAYRDVTRRDEVAQIGRFAIERVSRELRYALPGSVRVNGSLGTCIEFVPVLAASFYTDLPVQGFDPAADRFSAVDFLPPTTTPTRIAVFPVSNSDVYDQARIESIDMSSASVSAGEITIDFSSTGRQLPEHSPARRVYFIDTPVSFCVVGDELRRYSNYGYSSSQPVEPASGEVLLAEFIQTNDNGTTVAPFAYSPGNLQRNAIVQLDFRFLARDTLNEWVRFEHDVALVNVQ